MTQDLAVTLEAWAIIFAALGAFSEIFGLVMVVRQIAADRDRARKLLNKHRNWHPPKRPGPRRVSASSINVRPGGLGSMQVGGADLAGMFASLVGGHNQLVHDVEQGLDQRTGQLLEEMDRGDKELRDVLRELLSSSILERTIGVTAIGFGIAFAMIASILSTLAQGAGKARGAPAQPPSSA